MYHTTTTMSREALRPRILNVNYLPPPLILSSPPSSPKNVKNKVPSATSWTITLAQSALSRKTREIYKVVGCLMSYRLCVLTEAQLKLSSVRFMQQKTLKKSKSKLDRSS